MNLNSSAVVLAASAALVSGAAAQAQSGRLGAAATPHAAVDRGDVQAALAGASQPTAPSPSTSQLAPTHEAIQGKVDIWAEAFRQQGHEVTELKDGNGYLITRPADGSTITLEVKPSSKPDSLGAISIVQSKPPSSVSIDVAVEKQPVDGLLGFLKEREVVVSTMTFSNGVIGKIEGTINLASHSEHGLGFVTSTASAPTFANPTGDLVPVFIPLQNPGGASHIDGMQPSAVSGSVCVSLGLSPQQVHGGSSSLGLNGPLSNLGPLGPTLGSPSTGVLIHSGSSHQWNVNVGPNAQTGLITADPSSSVNVGTVRIE